MNVLLGRRDGEVKDCHTEIERLRNENYGLHDTIKKYDKWVKTRSNFELNKVQLKIKFDEIIKNFREAENLWAHIDETPNSTSMVGKDVERNGVPRPRHDVGNGAGAGTVSSGLEQTKDEGKKTEKGLFGKLGEAILPGRD